LTFDELTKISNPPPQKKGFCGGGVHSHESTESGIWISSDFRKFS